MKKYKAVLEYEKLTWKQIDKLMKESTLIIPCGSVEQHGEHLPMNVDKLIAKNLAAACAEKTESILAPEITFGARSHENSGGGYYKENISLEASILIEFYKSIINKYLNNQPRNIIIINSHWENEPYLIEAIELIKTEANITTKIAIISWWSLVNNSDIERIINKKLNWSLEHAGIVETSLMMHFCPEIELSTDNEYIDLHINTGIYSTKENDSIKKNGGALSSHKGANGEIGKKIVDKIIEGFEEFYYEWNN